MIRRFAVSLAFSLISIAAVAQTKPAAPVQRRAPAPRLATAPGQVALGWNQSPTPGVTGNKVYRAPCTGTVMGVIQPDGATVGTCSAAGTFAVIQTFTMPATTFTDTTVMPSTGYVYQVTALVETAESAPSNPAAVLTAPVAPPSNLTITATNEYESGGREHISATYQDRPNVATVAALFADDMKRLRIWAPPVSSSGTYTVTWGGMPFKLAWFVVSDAFGHSTAVEF